MKNWRIIQKKSFIDIALLADYLELDEAKRKELIFDSHFPICVPFRIANKIEKNSLTCPIALQFLPLQKECVQNERFTKTPVLEEDFQKCPHLLQKYRGRALLMTTQACGMHCRYCFRKNFDFECKTTGFDEEIEYLKNDESIHEVILSGGDPLALSDQLLRELIEEISKVSHIQIIRFHTRFPIGIPERITNELLSILNDSNKQIVFVIHINHPKEFDEDIFESLNSIKGLGIPILTQSVLLKNINDDLATLKELFLQSISHGIIPYYLHQLDCVSGSAHFEVSIEKGVKLIVELQKQLPGYAIPNYVQEIPRHFSKTPLH